MSPVLTFYSTSFAPYDTPDPATVLLEMTAAATASVQIDIYGLTFPPLMDALIAAHQRGVHVQIVADHSQSAGTHERPQLQRLVDAGIELVIGVSARGGIDHSKYLLIDAALGVMAPQSCVAFGSFNFSVSALSQDNTLTKTNDAAMVASFLANWQQVYSDAVSRHPEWQISPIVAAVLGAVAASPPLPALGDTHG